LLASTSVLAASLFAPAALAQNSAQAAPQAAPPAGAGSEPADGASKASAEIVVTALKGATSLQKTPAAVSVVTGDDLVKRQLTDVRGLSTFIPAAKSNVEATATQFFIRGVGKQVDQARIPDAVALVVDGLTVPQQASMLSLFDVSTIEVLPGPQGTLYGSSAIGGVVNITTNRPTSKLESSLLLEGGNYGTVHVTAVQNIPLNDDWSIRAAYNGSYHGAYNSNGTYTDNTTAFRLSSLYRPSPNLSVLLIGNYSQDNFRLAPTVPFPYLTSDPYKIGSNDPATAFFYPPNGVALDIPKVEFRVATITGRVDWNLGGVTLSYIGGYLHRWTPTPNKQDVAGFFETYSAKIDLINNELRISNSNGGRFHWIGGLYQSSQKFGEKLVFGPNLSGQDYIIHTKTYAAYGQATYSLTDQTRLTAGLRVSQDSMKMADGEVFFPTGAPPNFGRGVQPVSFDDKWKRLNWKVGAEQDIGPRSMLYASVQSGFNPGTFDGNAGADPGREVKPQSMIAYTAGIKNRFFGSALTLNLEGFFYSYKNQIITAPNLSTGATGLLNAPRSRIYGVEVDSVLNLFSGTKIRVGVEYLNGIFQRFEAGSATGPRDFSGFALPFSPKISGNLGLDQTFELGGKGSINARIDSYVTSSYWFTYDHIPGLKQSSYTKTDASISYRPPGEEWEVGVWCKNLENNAIAASAGSVAGRAYPGVVYVEPPRTFGVRFSIKFMP